MSGHGVPSLDGILDLVTGIWRSAVIKAAWDLDVVDHVRAGRDTAAAIAEAEGADPRRLRILLDAFCALGLADRDGERYRLEPMAELLSRSAGPIGTALPIWVGDPVWEVWAGAARAIRSGEPLPATPEMSRFFEEFSRATLGIALLQGAVAAHRLGVQPGQGVRVLDVGCGSGGIGYAFAQADPKATVVGVDLDAVPAARENAASLGIADRVEVREADIFSDVSFGEAEFDVAIVSHILHGADPDACRALLGRVARALRPGGRVAINEYVPDPERRREAVPLMFGLLMGILTPGGNVYTFSEIEGWLREAGFRDVEAAEPVASVTMIVAARS